MEAWKLHLCYWWLANSPSWTIVNNKHFVCSLQISHKITIFPISNFCMSKLDELNTTNLPNLNPNSDHLTLIAQTHHRTCVHFRNQKFGTNQNIREESSKRHAHIYTSTMGSWNERTTGRLFLNIRWAQTTQNCAFVYPLVIILNKACFLLNMKSPWVVVFTCASGGRKALTWSIRRWQGRWIQLRPLGAGRSHLKQIFSHSRLVCSVASSW